ncbi:protein Mis18-alpha [Conger conger]|uniref:protein Mis18-alpha n=1 Tax=Conger conger TaxID=82655 RepID=UPI002A5AE714|nr:protein Mis18-alpha [Conger conger]
MAVMRDIGLRNITYITESVADEESSLGQSELTYKEDAEAPMVFQCGRCKLPVGDSLSWVGSEDDQNQILLKRVTDNVVVGSEPCVSRTHTELGCLIVNLSCLGCSTPLGRVYTSTPRNLDYKRSLFCLSVENVDCYVLGSSSQKIMKDGQDEPVTLEYRVNVDTQIAKIKAIAVSMAQRLFEIEAKLQNSETK